MKNYSLKTKESSHRSRNARGLYKKLCIAAAALLVLFFGRGIIGTAAAGIFGPIYSVRQYLEHSSDSIPVYIRDRSALLEEIQQLEREIAAQAGMKNALVYLEEENAALRSLGGEENAQRIAAGVIARPPFSPYDTVIIDKGADDGIVSGAPVYYGSGYALGYVRSVYARHALVTLFSSPNVASTVYIFGPDIFTTAYGEGGGIMRLSVPQGITVQEGDLVALPSLERGILGTISSVVSVSTEPEQRAYVRLEVPLQSLRVVAAGTNAYMPAAFEEAFANVTDLEDKLFTVEVPAGFQATSTATSTPKASLETDTVTP